MNARYVPGSFKRAAEPPPARIREIYRGIAISGWGYSGIASMRLAVDRLWSSRLADARNEQERAAVLKAEQEAMQQPVAFN